MVQSCSSEDLPSFNIFFESATFLSVITGKVMVLHRRKWAAEWDRSSKVFILLMESNGILGDGDDVDSSVVPDDDESYPMSIRSLPDGL